MNQIEPICHTDNNAKINEKLATLYAKIRKTVEHIEINDTIRDSIS